MFLSNLLLYDDTIEFNNFIIEFLKNDNLFIYIEYNMSNINLKIIEQLLNKLSLNNDIVNIIVSYYLKQNEKKLLPWIDIKKLSWDYLSANPNAINLLKNNIDKISDYELYTNPNSFCLYKIDENPNNINKVANKKDSLKFIKNNLSLLDNQGWYDLSANSNAIHILEQNIDKINWVGLSSNINGIDILKKNKHKIHWKTLSKNPNAIELLKENEDKIDWNELSSNVNAIELLNNNTDKINWNNLSSNINAIELLANNLNKINWRKLSYNINAIELIKNNKDKINWSNLSSNPNAIEILKDNQDKIKWHIFSCNPAIFE